MDKETRHLIKNCAITNDDCRNSIPLNGLIHRIVELNATDKNFGADCYRAKLHNCTLVLTPKVLLSEKTWEILWKVQNFNVFNNNNDPHGEHDFGIVEVDKESYNFKFDYFQDETLQYAADNHLLKAYRVLTILHSTEY